MREIDELRRALLMNKPAQLFIDMEAEYELVRDNVCKLSAENTILRDALERIAYQHGSPNENIDYLAGIATEALQRAGGGE